MVPDRVSPLLEDAAERSRASLRTRLRRLRLSWRSFVQVFLSVGAAWGLATLIFGSDPAPFFAPIGALIVLGQAVADRRKRAAELVIGVPLGLAVADLVVLALGPGTLQLAVVVTLAVVAATLVGPGGLLATQAGVSAVLVATIQPPTDGINFNRAADALIGGAVALLVSMVLVPAHPVRQLRRAANPLLEELAATLEAIAAGIAKRDWAVAEAALDRARDIDELEQLLNSAVRESLETSRFRNPGSPARGRVETYAHAADQIDLAVRNVRVLARGVLRALRLEENVPPEVGTALRELAVSVRALGHVLDGTAEPPSSREPALRAAATATRVLDRTANLSVSVIVGQIRSTAVDLLTATGEGYDTAAEDVGSAATAAAAAEQWTPLPPSATPAAPPKQPQPQPGPGPEDPPAT